MNTQAILYHQRLKTISRRHPWIFSGAIRDVKDNPASGDIVSLHSEDGTFLARGIWSRHSSIRLRILTWQDEDINSDFWHKRLQESIQRRGQIPPGEARRLVHAENDYLPGLIVDKYGDWVILQALTPGIDRHKHELADMLKSMLNLRGVYERSDVDIRKKEGLELRTGVLTGSPPELIEITENGYTFLVDVYQGHKTGFYLDQRENRRLLTDIIQPGNRILNAFAYTGGFSVYAGRVAGEVISLDISESVLNLAERNLKLNGIQDTLLLAGDVFDILRDYRHSGEQFDIIILDPPKFAQNQKQVETASRGYKDINLLAFHLLKPGGYLMTFSCSVAISTELFRKIVFGALEDSRRDAQVLRQLEAAPDHPVALTYPEGAYLKGLLCQVI